MRRPFQIVGGWLLAAPWLVAQTPLVAAELLRYSLEETPTQLTRWLALPFTHKDSGTYCT